MLKVKNSGKWGAVAKNGTEVIPCQYDEILYFDDNLLKVKKEDKFGFIDKDGKEIIPCQLLMHEYYKFDIENCIIVNDKYLYGISYKNGETVVPCEYIDCTKLGKAFILTNKYGEFKKIDTDFLISLYHYNMKNL